MPTQDLLPRNPANRAEDSARFYSDSSAGKCGNAEMGTWPSTTLGEWWDLGQGGRRTPMSAPGLHHGRQHHRSLKRIERAAAKSYAAHGHCNDMGRLPPSPIRWQRVRPLRRAETVGRSFRWAPHRAERSDDRFTSPASETRPRAPAATQHEAPASPARAAAWCCCYPVKSLAYLWSPRNRKKKSRTDTTIEISALTVARADCCARLDYLRSGKNSTLSILNPHSRPGRKKK